jgi:hypothetical protein
MHSHRSERLAPPHRSVRFTSLRPGHNPPHRPTGSMIVPAQPVRFTRTCSGITVRQQEAPRRG